MISATFRERFEYLVYLMRWLLNEYAEGRSLVHRLTGDVESVLGSFEELFEPEESPWLEDLHDMWARLEAINSWMLHEERLEPTEEERSQVRAIVAGIEALMDQITQGRT